MTPAAEVNREQQVPIDKLLPPPKPVRSRMNPEALEDLAESIRKTGLLEPIVAVRNGDAFIVVAGHRRRVACEMAGLVTVTCRVFEPGELNEHLVKLDENACREDVTAAEEGWYFCEVIDTFEAANGRKPYEDELCRILRKKPDYIYDRIAIVRGYPCVAEAVSKKVITFSHGKQLNRCEVEEDAEYLLKQVITHGSSVRTLAYYVDQKNAERIAPAPAPNSAEKMPETAPHPGPEPIVCFYCGRGEDNYNLKPIYLHWYEVDMIKKALKDAGLEVKKL